ncbi:four helix bundle protein [Lutibacter sp.]|uniref:four helix bundle protein n=1 Tax=Lutibacter sp. TaxID=1925666 RepID=UPI002735ED40|nr:four helix bundle protein [Lutibacter sp.]MDP3312688.1 four helix bundle protein [Lutibacter sp.]
MSIDSINKTYDLEERTFQFAKEIRLFIKNLDKTIANFEDAKQVIRSSGSIGANYIEANESLSKKDFIYRIKISRKEAKESIYWLRLINETNKIPSNNKPEELIQESTELKKIFSAILEKSK